MSGKPKICWGILSTSKIGIQKVIPALQQGQYSKVVAIASRNQGRAEKAAASLGIDRVADSYKDLLGMAEIDAVYNPLPNHLHLPWSVKALQAGKHVLCEKPIGCSTDEAQKLMSEARKYTDLKVMEAFMYRHHPRWIKVKELAESGALGEVRNIRAVFSYYNDDPANIRNKPDMGGGSLMDIGCYCISVPRFIFGQEPVRVWGEMEIDQELGIDRTTSGMMEFSDGLATFTCATQLAAHQKVNILGTKGKIEIPMPFNPPVDSSTSIYLQTNQQAKEIPTSPCNQYIIQGDLFARAILEDRKVPTPLEDAQANMRALDGIIQSDKEGSWIRLGAKG